MLVTFPVLFSGLLRSAPKVLSGCQLRKIWWRWLGGLGGKWDRVELEGLTWRTDLWGAWRRKGDCQRGQRTCAFFAETSWYVVETVEAWAFCSAEDMSLAPLGDLHSWWQVMAVRQLPDVIKILAYSRSVNFCLKDIVMWILDGVGWWLGAVQWWSQGQVFLM